MDITEGQSDDLPILNQTSEDNMVGLSSSALSPANSNKRFMSLDPIAMRNKVKRTANATEIKISSGE